MGTTQELLAVWFADGVHQGATHMIVVCDTYDLEDYPVYVMPGEDAREKAFKYGADDGTGLPRKTNDNMSRVMEVYSLSQSMEDQLNELRAWHFD